MINWREELKEDLRKSGQVCGGCGGLLQKIRNTMDSSKWRCEDCKRQKTKEWKTKRHAKEN